MIKHIHLPKAAPQRGRTPGWHVQRSGKVTPESTTPTALPSVASAHYTLTPEGTNHGWPDYRDSDDNLILHSLIADNSPRWEEVKSVPLMVADIIDCRIPLPAVLFTRSGPTTKKYQRK